MFARLKNTSIIAQFFKQQLDKTKKVQLVAYKHT